MLPKPEEGLSSLGSFMRAARIARGINQKRAATEARVSRRQLAILEKGGNVSVQFLLKVARYLDITNIPLDGTVQFVSGQGGLNMAELLRALDLLVAFVENLRLLAMDAVLPPSERSGLTDTPVLRNFIDRHAADDAGVTRLTEAIRALAAERPGARPPAVTAAKKAVKSRRAPRRREP